MAPFPDRCSCQRLGEAVSYVYEPNELPKTTIYPPVFYDPPQYTVPMDQYPIDTFRINSQELMRMEIMVGEKDKRIDELLKKVELQREVLVDSEEKIMELEERVEKLLDIIHLLSKQEQTQLELPLVAR